MKLYVAVLSAIIWAALVWTAPVEKSPSDQNEIELDKRAQEAILYGNQQNARREKKKKSDPAVAPNADINVDLQGKVLAKPARDVVTDVQMETEPKSPIVEEIASSKSEEINKITPTESTGDESNSVLETGAEDSMSSGTSNDEVDPDVKDMLESSPAIANDETENEAPSPEAGVIPAGTGDDTKQMEELYKYLIRYENLLEDAPYNNIIQQYPQYYNYRRRRSLLNRLRKTHYNSNKAVKRGKRIKRDLFEDEYYYPYEDVIAPPVLEEPEFVEVGYPEPKIDEGDLLAYLLSLYDDKTEEPYEEYETPYERALEEAELEEEEQPVFLPVKRQMLSSLPGLRKRYFYPVNREPQTHWGAFVPEQKREYENAYDRVLRLARSLAAEEDAEYYPGLYEGYKKK